MPLLEYLSDFGDTLVAGGAALIIFAWLWARAGWVAASMCRP